MANELEEYILKRVERYANSAEGKAQIKKIYGIDVKRHHLYVGDPSKAHVDQGEFIKYGEQMKQILYAHISPLIKSITLDDIVVGSPKRSKDGQWSIELSFREGSLVRDSLSLDDSDGSGHPRERTLNNIVLLFAKGYHASRYVYGWWITKYGNHGSVRSRKDRPGDDFLIDAVNEFNTSVKEDIARAELVGEYKECSENPN